MKLPARKRAGIVVAALLGVDCVMHMFWASTGSSWPATTDKGLSRGLLKADFAFTPGVLFPLAAILLVATLIVLMRAGLLRRFAAVPTWLPQLVTIGTGAAVLVRAIAGVVWIVGIDASTTTPFYWLNLALYTPACLVMFAACVVVLRSRPIVWVSPPKGPTSPLASGRLGTAEHRDGDPGLPGFECREWPA